MASLRKAKKQAKREGRVFVEPDFLKRRKLAKKVQEQINIVNKRLKILDKKGYYNSFSSKKLFERLESDKFNALQRIKGKVVGVKLRDNMTITDLNAVSRASRNFLASATSTPSRIERVVRQTKQSMLKTLKIKKSDKITMEDIETYYEMLGDKDFDAFNEKIGASSMWSFIDEATYKQEDLTSFLAKLNKHNILNNEDMRKKAVNLYNKYV